MRFVFPVSILGDFCKPHMYIVVVCFFFVFGVLGGHLILNAIVEHLVNNTMLRSNAGTGFAWICFLVLICLRILPWQLTINPYVGNMFWILFQINLN